MIKTTTAHCISAIHDICSCRSHHHMVMTLTASIEIQEAVMVVIIWSFDLQFTTTYVIYN
jgi:hypothetical protein